MAFIQLLLKCLHRSSSLRLPFLLSSLDQAGERHLHRLLFPAKSSSQGVLNRLNPQVLLQSGLKKVSKEGLLIANKESNMKKKCSSERNSNNRVQNQSITTTSNDENNTINNHNSNNKNNNNKIGDDSNNANDDSVVFVAVMVVAIATTVKG